MLNEHLIKWLSRGVADKSSGSTARSSVAIATDIGLVRKENQDRVACMTFSPKANQGFPFFVVALSDGMGGMKNGAQCASRTIATFFSSLVRHKSASLIERMQNAAIDANENVFTYSGGYGGATLTAVLISLDGSAISLNVGDSRIYAESGVERKILDRLTVDDSLEEMVGGHGRDLLQYIGMGEGLKAHVKYVTPDFDKLLLTSDGVHFVHQKAMEDVFINSLDPSQAVSRLSALARWSGGPDNASLAVLSIAKIENLLRESDTESLDVWDAFSELNLLWLRSDSFPESRSSRFEPVEKILELKSSDPSVDELAVKDSILPKKNSRSKRKPKLVKKPIDKLQIVIEMDTNMESSDESSR